MVDVCPEIARFAEPVTYLEPDNDRFEPVLDRFLT